MKQKNFYFYTNIFAWALVLFLIGNYAFGWVTPGYDPPEGDLPPPLDTSSTSQTKTGDLTIDSLLKVGRYSSAPTGSTGALYYDTTANVFKGYKSTGWDSLGGGASLWTQTGNDIYYNTGKVGIGTTSPSANLDIVNASGPTVVIGGTDNNTQNYLQFLEQYNSDSSGVELFYDGINNELDFRDFDTSSNIMTLERTGNVGIGTTTPAQALSVVGNIYATGNVTCGGSCGGGGSSQWTTSGSNIYYNTGNVGIGTTTPSFALEVVGTGVPAVFSRADNGGNIIRIKNAENTFGLGTDNDEFFIKDYDDGDVLRFLIDTSGNVGIGTTTPNNLLSVYQLIDFNNTDFNTKLGYQAGKNIVSGATDNTFVGYQAGLSSVAGSTNAADNNTAVGYQSFYSNTTGHENTAMGLYALRSNTTGYYNTANGVYALYSNTEGNYNTANGKSALYSNTTGSENTTNGYASLYSNTTGSANTANGKLALYSNTTGGSNTVFGYKAGYLTNSSNNILIGYQAGDNLTDCGNNIVIGYDINAPSDTGYGTLNIGNLIFATGVDGTQYTLSTGNVGIGITAPAAKLDIADGGVIAHGAATIAEGNGYHAFEGRYSSGTTSNYLGSGTTATGYNLIGSYDRHAGFGVYLGSNISSPVVWMYDAANNAFDIRKVPYNTDFTAGSSLMVVRSSGNVGIGTTIPGSLLTVAGPISTNAPTTKTVAYSLTATDSSLIFNGTASITLTLQAASSYPGRILHVKTIAAYTVVSASSNVVPLTSATAGTAILAATAGKWAMLQSDGTNWVVMAGN